MLRMPTTSELMEERLNTLRESLERLDGRRLKDIAIEVRNDGDADCFECVIRFVYPLDRRG